VAGSRSARRRLGTPQQDRWREIAADEARALEAQAQPKGRITVSIRHGCPVWQHGLRPACAGWRVASALCCCPRRSGPGSPGDAHGSEVVGPKRAQLRRLEADLTLGPHLVRGGSAFWMQTTGAHEDRHCLPNPLRVSTVAQGWGCASGLLYFAAVQRSSMVVVIIRSVDSVARAGDLGIFPLTWPNRARWCASLTCVARCYTAKFRPGQTRAVIG
jgi:hypothetical protein